MFPPTQPLPPRPPYSPSQSHGPAQGALRSPSAEGRPTVSVVVGDEHRLPLRYPVSLCHLVSGLVAPESRSEGPQPGSGGGGSGRLALAQQVSEGARERFRPHREGGSGQAEAEALAGGPTQPRKVASRAALCGTISCLVLLCPHGNPEHSLSLPPHPAARRARCEVCGKGVPRRPQGCRSMPLFSLSQWPRGWKLNVAAFSFQFRRFCQHAFLPPVLSSPRARRTAGVP